MQDLAARPQAGERTRSWTGIVFLGLLLVVLWAHLFGALATALTAYTLYSSLLRRLRPLVPGWLAAALSLAVTVIGIGLLVMTAVHWLESDRNNGLEGLTAMLASSLEQMHSRLPAWLAAKLPQSVSDAQHSLAGWLHSHGQELQRWGHSAVRSAAHLLLGVIVGLLCAFERQPSFQVRWACFAQEAARDLALAFADVVSAQLRIAAANTIITAAFLYGALPAAGIHLPFTGALIGLTFAAGLLPIIGNLISNAAIILIALTVSPLAAGAALVFLLLVHKLEYLLNAHFVGRTTKVPASVLIGLMVLFEALFGIAGLVAAPIYCAWAFRFYGLRESGGRQADAPA